MRLLCAVLAVVVTLSCGGGTSAPTPASPTTPSIPPSPDPTPAPTPTAYSISGTVRDNTGAPLAGAQVFIGCGACKSGPWIFQTTNASGTYSGTLQAGSWEHFVRKPGFTEISSSGFIVTGNMTRDFTLNPGVRVSGRTYEEGVGALTGVRIEVIGGPNDGLSDVTNPPGVENSYSLALLPGTHRLRASKAGYDSIERIVTAAEDTSGIDFTMKWSYGSCLRSVSPVLFENYRSSGGEETVTVDVNPGRTWSATASSDWLSVTSASSQDSGRLTFRVQPSPAGAFESRSGAIMIRCSATEGQNIWIVQQPNCQVALTPHADTPAEFPASGGVGRLTLRTGIPGCRWESRGGVDWVRTAGVRSWSGDFDNVTFVVSENTTGAPRTGTFLVNDTVWIVKQR